MRRVLLVAAALCVICDVAGAEEPTCETAARSAEIRSGLPSGMLGAIGQIESGTSRVARWSVNANDGSPGMRFANETDAEEHVGQLLETGNRMVDLGCFQIDLYYHPDAFARWQDAFDPDANAAAAARILQDLHARTGDWKAAVSLYHSADPVRGSSYLRSWLSAWSGRPQDAIAWSSASPGGFDPYRPIATAVVSLPAVFAPGIRTSVARRSSLPRVVTP